MISTVQTNKQKACEPLSTPGPVERIAGGGDATGVGSKAVDSTIAFFYLVLEVCGAEPRDRTTASLLAPGRDRARSELMSTGFTCVPG